MAHTNIHDPLHVYSIRELPLTQLPVDNTIDTLQISLFFHASIGVSLPGKFKTGRTLSRNHVSYYNAEALYLFSF